MANASVLGRVVNDQVTVVRRINDRYYYVSSGKTTGYLWVGWVKK